MKTLLPGQAVIARHEGKVWFVVYDERENLSLGGMAVPVSVDRRNGVVLLVEAK